MVKRAVAFWLSCVLIVAVVSAWDTYIAGNIEPDFGGPFGNFGATVGILAALSIPAAICHGIIALLFQPKLANASSIYLLALSSLAGTSFVVTLFLASLVTLPFPPDEVPLAPLVFPCVLGSFSSVCVFFIASLLRRNRNARAA